MGLITGSDFEKKLDAMIERMEASGMTEQEMLKTLTQGTPIHGNDKGEI